ncbi:putative ribonuclease H-like domain-containing protein, partial [Tanacetum coccineum]
TSTRPKAKGLVIHEEEQATTLIVSLQQPSQAKIQHKGKAKMIEPEPVKNLSKKDNSSLMRKWLKEKRKKHFAAKRAEEKRNRPPTKTQQRSIMCTYLKNMEGWKPKYLKNKSFANIQELFDKAMKKVNTFVDYRTELVKGTELRSLMEVIPNEEKVAVDIIPLATKPPSIVDWKIHKEGKKSYYQIIRADGGSKMYLVFSHMLKSFDREDLETLYKLVKAKYGSTRPVEDLDLVLYGDLKTMFDPHVEYQVWKNQSDYRVLELKLYDSCGVHSLRKKICTFILVPRAVLMKSGLVSVNTARQVNTAHSKTTVNAARPMSYLSKTAHSTVKRPIHKNTTFKNSNINQRVNTVRGKKFNTARPKAVVNVVKGNNVNAVKASACWVWKLKTKVLDHGNPQMDLQDQGVIDSGCSRHMTGNMSYLTDYEEIDGGYVAFGENPKGGKITRKGTIKTSNLDFENVYFVRELKFNLFSVSQMCDKKNSVLFNDTECIVLSPNFKLIDESQVLLRVPRKNNMYSVDLKNIVYKRGFTSLFAKSTSDESKIWHRRLGHLNFKTINKLVKGNLVRGLPSKLFENDQNCVACQKGKQHKASCKSKTENSISLPLHLLHMDLFGLTFVKSLMKKMYCLVITDDYSRFTWIFFLATKNETSGILKSFITRIENLVDHKVKVIRCDNGTEFKNKEMNQFYEMKGILRQYSVARTPQQNRFVERRNRTLIEAARTMLADSKLPTTF